MAEFDTPFLAIDMGSMPAPLAREIVSALRALPGASKDALDLATGIEIAIDEYRAEGPVTVLKTVDCQSHGFEVVVAQMVVTPIGSMPLGWYYANTEQTNEIKGLPRLPRRNETIVAEGTTERPVVPELFLTAFGSEVEPAPDLSDETEDDA